MTPWYSQSKTKINGESESKDKSEGTDKGHGLKQANVILIGRSNSNAMGTTFHTSKRDASRSILHTSTEVAHGFWDFIFNLEGGPHRLQPQLTSAPISRTLDYDVPLYGTHVPSCAMSFILHDVVMSSRSHSHIVSERRRNRKQRNARRGTFMFRNDANSTATRTTSNMCSPTPTAEAPCS
uniref:Uncharacterized protein n=1 Tax=Craspedostauros australis TaxID=1486917 RepID=A0A6T6FLH4_9STRA|mmetsp:Transcript_19685/g.54744  ORF Transcript_19685/g.54744 Transcript_19685/m.54744 type:complete len:181 (+) Transcript_19685:195-737(+)